LRESEIYCIINRERERERERDRHIKYAGSILFKGKC